MDCLEAIRKRRSVRTFDGRPLGPAEKEKILAYAEAVQNPYELPIAWRMLDAAEHGLSSPVIVGEDTYIGGKMVWGPHAEEAFGFAFERIVLYAQTLGVGTTWMAGTMDRALFEKAMELKQREVMPCVSPLGYPAAKMSLRESLMRKGVGADVRLPFSDLFFEESFEKPLTPETAGALTPLLELVRWAPSAVNKQPWRIVLAGKTAHFYEKKSRIHGERAGWDVQRVDMGIALCHYFCGLEAAGRTPRLVLSDPGLPMPPETQYVASVV